jgi:hypothetical protein
MKLFKHDDDSGLYQVHELTEDQLIALFSMCISYKDYARQLLNLPTHSLRKIASGGDLVTLRESLALQLKTCDEYIAFWKEVTNAEPAKKSQN